MDVAHPVLLALLCVTGLSGCGCTDGGFRYHLSGKLVDDATDQPVDCVRFTATGLMPDDRVGRWLNYSGSNVPTSQWEKTDAQGKFIIRLESGIAWGDCVGPFGLGPLYRPPRPPALDRVLFAVDGAHDWTTLRPTAEQQKRMKPAERWIDLGTIRVKEHGRKECPGPLEPEKLRPTP